MTSLRSNSSAQATDRPGGSSSARATSEMTTSDLVPDLGQDVETIGPAAELSGFREWRSAFVSTLKWLVSGMISVNGVVRMLSIAFMAFVGSIAMSIMSFAIIFIIRSAAPSESDSFRGIPVPDLPLGVMLTALLVGGTIGSFLFYTAEQRASAAAIDYGDNLRARMLSSLNRPLSRGWQTAFDGKPQQVLTQTLVAGIRDITVASRDTVRLIGPSSMFVATLAALFFLEPAITAMIVPIGLVFAIPVYFINRRVQRLNASFEATQGEAADALKSSIEELLEGGHSESVEQLREAARYGDQVTHDRMLEPIRIKSLTTVLSSFFAAAVLGLFVLRTGDDELNFMRLIVYVIVLRLCSNSVTKLAGLATNLARRSSAIDRYRKLEDELAAYRQHRIDRLDAAELPSSFEIEPQIGSPVRVASGKTIVVLVPRPPKRSSIDLLLLDLENHLDEQGITADLLGSARVYLGDEFQNEQHVVGTTATQELHPLQVMANTDLTTAAMYSNGYKNVVVTNIAAKSWGKQLDDWDHLVSGVVVLVDNQFVCGGPLSWIRENRGVVLELLGRPDPDEKTRSVAGAP